MMCDTDYIELMDHVPLAACLSQAGTMLAVTTADMKIRLFEILTGKLIYTHEDEMIENILEAKEQNSKYLSSFKKQDFEKKLSIEKELGALWTSYASKDKMTGVLPTIGFDERDKFMFFGTLSGIKIIDIKNKELKCQLGASEVGERFLNVQLYQGSAQRSTGAGAAGFGGATS